MTVTNESLNSIMWKKQQKLKTQQEAEAVAEADEDTEEIKDIKVGKDMET